MRLKTVTILIVTRFWKCLEKRKFLRKKRLFPEPTRKPRARVTNSALAFTYIRNEKSRNEKSRNEKSRNEKSSSILDLDVGRIFVMLMREYQARDWLRKIFCFANVTLI